MRYLRQLGLCGLVIALMATITFLSGGPAAAADTDTLRVGDASRDLCLDVGYYAHRDRVDGARTQQWSCWGGGNQEWYRDGDQIRSSNGLCLDIHRPDFDNRRNGGKVQLWGCSGQPNQKWVFDGDMVKAKGTNLCLDVHAPHYNEGRNRGKVQVWACTSGNINQHWTSDIMDSGSTGGGSENVGSFYCASNDLEPGSCPVGGEIYKINSYRRVSTAPCAGNHWASGDRIEVRNGCRAHFNVSWGNTGSLNTQCDVNTAGRTPNSHCGLLTIDPDRVVFTGQPTSSTNRRPPITNSPNGDCRGQDDDVAVPCPANGGVGSFRVKCFFSHFGYADPVIAANPPANHNFHLHAFFGATSVDNNTDSAALRSQNQSTCMGGTINNSSYWVPALMDRQGEPVAPEHVFVYYKSGYELSPSQSSEADRKVHNQLPDIGTVATVSEQTHNEKFTCKVLTGSNPDRVNNYSDSSSRPQAPTLAGTNCQSGDLLVMNVRFNQCWNPSQTGLGVPLGRVTNGSCSPQLAIPKIEFQVYYKLPASVNNLRLSSDDGFGSNAGATLHGDWVNGWNRFFSDSNTGNDGWIGHCIRASRSCSNHFKPNTPTNWQRLGSVSDQSRASAGGLIH